MQLEELATKLYRLLKEPLPGRLGQFAMAPQPVDEQRFLPVVREDHRKGAVLMLFYPDESGAFVPFIKRPDYDGVHSGQVALPGGKMDPGDLDLSFTALREAKEEIGVDPSKIELLGKLTEVYIPPSNFLVSPFIGITFEKPVFQPDPVEVARIISCPVPTLLDKNIRKMGRVKASSGLNITTPYFDIEQEMVWGATAMMLSEFNYLWERSNP